MPPTGAPFPDVDAAPPLASKVPVNATVAVLSTHMGTTTIHGGDGADTFNVAALSGKLLLDTGAGADTINVGTLHGTVDEIATLLTVFGGADGGFFASAQTV